MNSTVGEQPLLVQVQFLSYFKQFVALCRHRRDLAAESVATVDTHTYLAAEIGRVACNVCDSALLPRFRKLIKLSLNSI